ncbi:hypothetical protein FB451DRAFT_1184350 [Mycena latifolia]|nr:hypothetical protein FB451DRAFT_1184350 [Mycena latifolia]
MFDEPSNPPPKGGVDECKNISDGGQISLFETSSVFLSKFNHISNILLQTKMKRNPAIERRHYYNPKRRRKKSLRWASSNRSTLGTSSKALPNLELELCWKGLRRDHWNFGEDTVNYSRILQPMETAAFRAKIKSSGTEVEFCPLLQAEVRQHVVNALKVFVADFRH